MDLARVKRWTQLLSRISPAELSKFTGPLEKARTERLARTFARYVLAKDGYNPVFLLSRKGHESAGIVDLVAVRKHQDHEGKRDATEIVLVQVKGNGKVSEREKARLLRAIDKVQVRAAILEYQPGQLPTIRMLPEANVSPELTAKSVSGLPELDSAQRHLMYGRIVSNEPLRNFPKNESERAGCVDPKRSEAAKKAWQGRSRKVAAASAHH